MGNHIRIIEGDCRKILPTLPDNSVHCCITSPPYWGLRDYEVTGQIGLESNLTDFIKEMVQVFREVKRILRPDGTLWLNLGDAYAGSPSGSFDTGNRGSGPLEGGEFRTKKVFNTARNGLKPKDLVGMPWRVALALQEDGWYLRQDIIWSKPNPMPESVTDRCTKAHEYIFLLTKSERYYYDSEAIKEDSQASDTSKQRYQYGRYNRSPQTVSLFRSGKPDFLTKKGNNFGPIITNNRKNLRSDIESRHRSSIEGGQSLQTEPDGKRNKRSVWTVTTQPFKEAHFATFPQKLIEPCILAGTSEKGCCKQCGNPHERIIEKGDLKPIGKNYDKKAYGVVIDNPDKNDQGRNRAKNGHRANMAYEKKTVGWKPTCNCNQDIIPCTVLDPFGGAGTVALVSTLNRRDSILIELNPDYIKIAERRIKEESPQLFKPEITHDSSSIC